MQKVTDAKTVTITKIWVLLADYDDVGWAPHSQYKTDPRQDDDENEWVRHLVEYWGEDKLELREYDISGLGYKNKILR